MLLALALDCLLVAGAGAVSAGGAGEPPGAGEVQAAEADLGHSTHLFEPGAVSALSFSGTDSKAMVPNMQARLAELRDDLGTLEARNAQQAADNEAAEGWLREAPPDADRRAQLARMRESLRRDDGPEVQAAELGGLRSELESTKAHIESARPRVEAKLRMLAEEKQRAQGELLQAEKKAKEMNELMDGADMQLGTISERMALLPKQLRAFQRKIDAEIKTRDAMVEQIPQLKKQLSDHYRENNRSYRELSEWQEDLQSVADATQGMRKGLLELSRRRNTLELIRSDFDESRKTNEQLRSKQATLLDQKRRLEIQAGELSQSIASMLGEMEPISAETQRGQDRLRKSQNQLRQLKDSRAHVHEGALRAVEQTLAEFAKMYNDVQQAISSMGGAGREI